MPALLDCRSSVGRARQSAAMASATGTMDVLLGPRPPLDVVLDGAKVLTSSSSRNSLARAYVELACRVVDPFQETWVVDIDSSEGRGSMKKGCSPCLTKSRAPVGGHWVTSYGRRLGTDAMLKLQHMNPERLRRPNNVPMNAFNGMIGNAMSVNIVGGGVGDAKPLLSISPRNHAPLPDRWSA